MADRSAIEWTEATWNPVTGCDRISTGCDHCYAMTLAKRLKAMGYPNTRTMVTHALPVQDSTSQSTARRSLSRIAGETRVWSSSIR